MFKKGNVIVDGILFLIVVFVVTLIALFGGKLFTDLRPDITNDLQHNESKEAFNEIDTRYPTVLDGLIVLIFFGMWAAGIASALMSPNHPLLFGVMMIAMVFVIIAGVILGNFYEELFEDAELATLTDSYPKTHWILTHMLQIGIVIVFSIAIIYFGRNK